MVRLALVLAFCMGCADPVKEITDHDGDGVDDEDDCDPWNPAVSPDEVEICDGFDNDCDGAVDDDDIIDVQGYQDADGDGYAGTPISECVDDLEAEPSDCDDDNDAVHPGASETCTTTDDDDCDGDTNPVDASGCETWFLDEDGDEYGAEEGDTRCLCVAEAPYTAPRRGDCDDSDASLNPGAGTCWVDGTYTMDETMAAWFTDFDGDLDTSLTGAAVTGLGDMNGDGVMDLAFGAATYPVEDREGGAAFVVYGPKSGDFNVTDADAMLTEGSDGDNGLGRWIGGPGDMDGDGYTDVAIGRADPDPSGRLGVIFSGPLYGLLSTDEADGALVLSGDEAYNGWPFAATDTNSDGLTDLLFRAGGLGHAWLLEGPIDGDVPVEDAAVATIGAEDDGGGVILELSGDGDGDGDGVADLWVTGCLTAGCVAEDSGASTQGWFRFQGPVEGDVVLSDADARVLVPLPADLAVAATGDLDGDGNDDPCFGVQDDSEGADNSGDVYVQTGLVSGVWTLDDLEAHVVGLVFIVTDEGYSDGENLGASVASPGDLNGDGIDEIMFTAEGVVDVYYGPMEGVYDPTEAPVILSYYVSGAEEETWYGSSVVAPLGDFDGDGAPDLLMGGTTTVPRGVPADRPSGAWVYSGTPDPD